MNDSVRAILLQAYERIEREHALRLEWVSFYRSEKRIAGGEIRFVTERVNVGSERRDVVTDWPALILRLESRRVNIRLILKVSRITIWKWRAGMCKPNGDHAASLIALDCGAERGIA